MGSPDQLAVQDRDARVDASDAAPSNPMTQNPAPYNTVGSTSHEKHDGTPSWQRRIWIGCSVGLMLVICLLCLISAFALGKTMLLLEDAGHDHLFQFAGMILITGSLLRLLAILIGGAISFVGLAVSFFAHQRATSIDMSLAHEKEAMTTAALVTYSPGIVAIAIGATIIISALYARGHYNYHPESVTNQAVPANLAPYGLPTLDELLDKPEKPDEHQETPPAPGG